MEEADHSPVEAKSMGRSIPHKFLIKAAPPKVLPALWTLPELCPIHPALSGGSKVKPHILNILPILPAQTTPFTIPNTSSYLLVIFLYSE